MKRQYSSIIIAIQLFIISIGINLICSCSNDNDAESSIGYITTEEIDFLKKHLGFIPEQYSLTGYLYDYVQYGTAVCWLDENRHLCFSSFLNDDKLGQWTDSETFPTQITIDKGYGVVETADIYGFYRICHFQNTPNGFIAFFKMQTSSSSYEGGILVFCSNGKFTKIETTSTYVSSVKWYNNSVLVTQSDSKFKILQYSSNGNLIQSYNTTYNIINGSSEYRVVLSNEDYAEFYVDVSSSNLGIKYYRLPDEYAKDEITEKFPFEIQSDTKYDLKILDYSNDIVTLHVDFLFYSGEKKAVDMEFNTKTKVLQKNAEGKVSEDFNPII